ncbi:O-antigen ligase family protein [Cohnella rhizosphaerae]|uniref:O-antigen ligase family protein n=1 Tax=Cohnella rhizosphaerae TaxID=1457232 RepID=A0A9X4KWG5_9BACL|nr:O-antigen ligase family protein [Cohnella rhizosphaerae]MDG0811561.1 O-antigen ligase family protein [Cohnella rhizosphaerae]
MPKQANVRTFDSGTIILFLFLCTGPFVHGFMFESELAGAAIVVLFGFLVFLLRARLRGDIILYLLLALTVLYAASVGYGADRHESLLSLLKVSLLAPLYVFVRAVSATVMARIWEAWTWLLGLSVPISIAADRFVDGRLAGFIDYANGYAILLLVGVLIAYGLAAAASPSIRRNLLQIPIFLGAAGTYLTESRTVLVLLFASFAVLYFLKGRAHRMLWLRTSSSVALGLIAGVMYGWLPWLVLPVAAIFMLLYRIPESETSKRAVRISLLVVSPLLGTGAIWFGSGMADRWSAIASRTGEGATRLVYYRDAWMMFMDSPLWGFGAGAWMYMQYHYQTAAYFTAYIHSQPLQVMTETGVFGLLLFIGICVFLVGRCLSSARRNEGVHSDFDAVRGIACCVLLVHSLVDFTLSFPYLLGLLIIIGTAPANTPIVKTNAAKAISAVPIVAKFVAALAAASLLTVATLLFISDRLQQSAVRAIAEQRKADAVDLLDRSAKMAIFADRIYDRKARLYLSEFESGGDRRYLDVARDENKKGAVAPPRTNLV